MGEKSFCLASQQIRRRIKSGKIHVPVFDESKIQPSSFEPTISNEAFILDAESGFSAQNEEQTVYRRLLQLPRRRRQKVSIEGGFELKKGFTYLLPLEEKVTIENDEYIKSSPKSSLGRLFLNTRLAGDFNSSFDELNNHYARGRNIDLWLLVQPLAFNVIINPGQTLNQLRFFKGHGAQLTTPEVIEEFKKNPFLLSRDINNELVPVDPHVSENLFVHLNASGKQTEGIVGLRARHNPQPIDLRVSSCLEAEEFFEPVKAGEGITIKKGEYYLLASLELLKIPPHLNVELISHSHSGFEGPLHFAGFVDNGFMGDLVFEVRSDEIAKEMTLEHKTPISTLNVYRTPVPDKLYGKKIGSSYQGQIGPKPSKHFRTFDFTHAARNYQKLDRMVLVEDAKLLKSFRKNETGFEFADEKTEALIRECARKGFFHSRYDCEDDELVLQFLPYVLLFRDDKTVFCYSRSKDIKTYGEKKLFGKRSIGVGGHIIPPDGPFYLQKCIEREVIEEEVEIEGDYSEPRLVGTLFAKNRPVDKVHFGLIYKIHLKGDVRPNEKSITGGKMIPIKELEKAGKRNFETWSSILAPHLNAIYKM